MLATNVSVDFFQGLMLPCLLHQRFFRLQPGLEVLRRGIKSTIVQQSPGSSVSFYGFRSIDSGLADASSHKGNADVRKRHGEIRIIWLLVVPSEEGWETRVMTVAYF